jgi:aspartate racemase
MKPETIGIVGGAGPLAGAFLLERLLSLSRSDYGCYRDSDFPKIILISYPFSEMLSKERDSAQITSELTECLRELRKSGATLLAIACNTLHAFLDPQEDLEGLVHLPQTLADERLFKEPPLIFCTSTSAELKLHQQFFPCSYPDTKIQEEVDSLIAAILKKSDSGSHLATLEALLQKESANTLLLGCTELSLLSAQLKKGNKVILDPLEILAKTLLKKAFAQ